MSAALASPLPKFAFLTCHLELGGSTTFLSNLSAELSRQGASVKIFSFSSSVSVGEEFARAGIEVFSQDERRHIFEDRMRATLGELQRFGPNLVAACLGPESFEALRYVPESVFKVGLAQSDEASVYQTFRAYRKFMDAAGGVSLAVCDNLRSLEIPVHYLPYGVPMPRQLVRERRSVDAPLRILYLGRLCKEQKRVHLFPELLEKLRASEIPFQWTIAGTGEMEATLRRHMQSPSGNQSVQFLGAVQYSDVPTLLLDHDIYLLMSDYEGLPLSLLEAMGSGLVPVVSALPSGIPDVVDSESGIMVPTNDTSGFAAAITSLHSDRAKLEAMSRQARARAVGGYSVRAMGQRWLSIPLSSSAPTQPWTLHNIRAPLTAKQPFYFSRAFRGFRRLVKKLT